MFQHKHYCPQTASCAQDCCNQHINCCGGGMPAPAPTAVAGAQSNALPNMPHMGMGPGMGGPGMGPGMMGPGMAPGMGPGMAPGMAPGMGPGMAPGQFPRPKRFWG